MAIPPTLMTIIFIVFVSISNFFMMIKQANIILSLKEEEGKKSISIMNKTNAIESEVAGSKHSTPGPFLSLWLITALERA
jgi:hypothetical protein